jgi:hypothetical protein
MSSDTDKLSIVEIATIISRKLELERHGLGILTIFSSYNTKDLIDSYIKKGGDPKYFLSGAGRPGNCQIM